MATLPEPRPVNPAKYVEYMIHAVNGSSAKCPYQYWFHTEQIQGIRELKPGETLITMTSGDQYLVHEITKEVINLLNR